MRDAAIMQAQQASARRDALLYSQFEFLKTRQEALERVVMVSGLRDRLTWIWNPKKLLEVVDAVQIKLMQDAAKAKEAKHKIAVVPGVTAFGAKA